MVEFGLVEGELVEELGLAVGDEMEGGKKGSQAEEEFTLEV